MGDCPGPRKETTTRRNVTQGGGGILLGSILLATGMRPARRRGRGMGRGVMGAALIALHFGCRKEVERARFPLFHDDHRIACRRISVPYGNVPEACALPICLGCFGEASGHGDRGEDVFWVQMECVSHCSTPATAAFCLPAVHSYASADGFHSPSFPGRDVLRCSC